ncbi:Hypothetical predicted protein [Olea europaea subsp. europaea]|uniref:FHA domain-containing protein n=1 Tax=Olea europaea subsp. europaea TaxID=158383 RepID=A0A8S0TAL0_OLEEU|nr:Hypothetical predicted protein [Olea europaea subsp. europaea]
MDILSLAEPGNSIFSYENEHPSADCIIENPVSNPFGINGDAGLQDRVEDLPLSDIENPAVFGQTNQNGGNVHTEFRGTSFPSFGYLPPLPQMPTWSTMHHISATSLPVQLGESGQQTGKAFVPTEADYVNNTDASNLKNSIPNMRNLILSPEDVMELTMPPVSQRNEKSLLSDQEEPCSENDLDVPYFSDVEAMIFDMNLSPDEFDLQLSQEVKQYKRDETRKSFIRLEQAVDGYMVRTIAAQGAFAPEVLLWRATEDVEVDIDSGREKNGCKISQEAGHNKEGHIWIHNKEGHIWIIPFAEHRKSPVSINGNEVASTMSVTLTPGCLIEVRGLPFIFKTNDMQIKKQENELFTGP